jgi:hypothetical protein
MQLFSVCPKTYNKLNIKQIICNENNSKKIKKNLVVSHKMLIFVQLNQCEGNKKSSNIKRLEK